MLVNDIVIPYIDKLFDNLRKTALEINPGNLCLAIRLCSTNKLIKRSKKRMEEQRKKAAEIAEKCKSSDC